MEAETAIKEVMASVLDIRAQDIVDATSPATVQRWDSLRHMSLIVAVEDALGVRLSEERIPELLSFRALCDAVAQARTSASA